MRLPTARGPLSDMVVGVLAGHAGSSAHLAADRPFPSLPEDVAADGDFQLALWTMYK